MIEVRIVIKNIEKMFEDNSTAQDNLFTLLSKMNYPV